MAKTILHSFFEPRCTSMIHTYTYA